MTCLPTSPPWHTALIAFGTTARIVTIMGGRRLLSAVKRRVTYPRTGYVDWLPLPIALACSSFGEADLETGMALVVSGGLALRQYLEHE